MDTKTCTKCGETYPATTEYFYMQAGKLRSRCKKCIRQYYEENRSARIEYQNQYCMDNHERVIECKRRYRSKNRDKLLKDGHRYRITNPDKILEQQRNYRENNRDKIIARSHKYYSNNTEKTRLRNKRWRNANPDKIRAKNDRRRARLMAAEGTYTSEDIEIKKSGQTDGKGRLRCWWCGKVIKNTYHIDHVIPLVEGGKNDVSNIVISCPKCNTSKGAKLPHEWNGRLF